MDAPRPDDKRKSKRYTLSGDFPFRTKLTLFQNGGVKTSDAKGKDWSVTPVNLSATGASLQLSLAVVAYQREACRMKFSLGTFLLEIPATIAHFRCGSQFSLCGIVFNFTNAETQRSYLQLLESVSLGSSLTPVDAVQDTPDRHKEQFGDNPTAALSIWRDAPTGSITSFDLRMHNYVVRWIEGSPELDVSGLGEISPAEQRHSFPDLVSLSEAQHDEVRRLFSLTVLNMPKSMPEDVRKFFANLVA